MPTFYTASPLDCQCHVPFQNRSKPVGNKGAALSKPSGAGYATSMNLAFYKLQAGGSPWILVEAITAQASSGADTPALDYGQAARLLCHRLHGTGADGLILMEPGATPCVRFWSAQGSPRHANNAALLCAARWCFDTGRSSSDLLSLKTDQAPVEVMAIDPRILSIQIGHDSRLSAKTAQLSGPQIRQLRTSQHYSGSFHFGQKAARYVLHLWDGPLPRSDWPVYSEIKRDSIANDQIPVCAGVINRQKVQLRTGKADPLLASAAALLQASALGLCESQIVVRHRREEMIIHRTQDGFVFGAARAHYCLTGEIWLPENGETFRADSPY